MALRVPVTPNTRAAVDIQGYQENNVDVGSGLRRIGNAISETGTDFQEKQKKRESTEADLAYVNQANSDAELLDDQSKHGNPSSPDFVPRMQQTFDARHTELLNTFKAQHFSKDTIDNLEVRLAAHRGGLVSASRSIYNTAYHGLVENKVNDYKESSSELMRKSPDALEASYSANHDFAQSLVDLTPEERVVREAELNNANAIAAAATEAVNHPGQFIQETGGVDHVTKLEATSKVPFSTAPTAPSGQLSLPIVTGLISRGLPPSIAKGVAAGIAAEAANDPNALNKEGGGQGAFGLGQWRGPRQAALKKLYGDHPTQDQQLDFLVSELKGGDKGGAAVVSQTDEVSALHHYIQDFMRPSEAGGKGDVSRGLAALGRKVVQTAQADTGTRSDATGGPVIDSRWKHLTTAQIFTLQGQAQRQIDREQSVSAAQDAANHASFVNSAHLAIHDGNAGLQDIQTWRDQGKLTDYNEIKSLEDEWKAKHKTNEALDLFNAKWAAGAPFNRYDPNDKPAIEAGVDMMAKSLDAHGQPLGFVAAAFNIWNKTGVLAENGAAAIRGGLISTNPSEVQATANIAGNMLRRDPHAFTGVAGGSDMEEAALHYNHYVYDLNKSPNDAATQLAQENDPKYKAALKITEPEIAKFKKDVEAGKVPAAKIFSGFLGYGTPGFINATQEAEANTTYAELASEQLAKHADRSTALATAAEQMKKFYGVTKGGAVMKYAPELSYPVVNGSHDYIYRDAVKAVKDSAGVDLTKEIQQQEVLTTPFGIVRRPTSTTEHYDGTANVRLVAVPRKTNIDFQQGVPARYKILYTHTVDGHVITDAVPGLFRASPDDENAKMHEQMRDIRGLHQIINTTVPIAQGALP